MPAVPMASAAASSRPRVREWFAVLAYGAFAGGMILGVGGRIAMRVLAIMQEWTLSFTPIGSLTIVLIGVAAGIGFGAVLLVLRALPQLSPTVIAVLYWMVLVAISLRVLQPVDRDRLTVFPPLVLVFGLTQQLGSTRLIERGRRPC